MDKDVSENVSRNEDNGLNWHGLVLGAIGKRAHLEWLETGEEQSSPSVMR